MREHQYIEELEAEVWRSPDLKLVSPAVEETTPEASVDDEFQVIIDESLQLVYAQHYRITSRLYPPAMVPISLEQLRDGPLGQDLSLLAQVAAGKRRADREDVLGTIGSVIQLLFWPVGADFYVVPRSFWQTPLGKVLSLAKYRAFEPDELMSVGQAAKRLGISRATVYRWMGDRSLDYVRDDTSGRTLVVREDVEAMLAAIQAEQNAAEGGGGDEGTRIPSPEPPTSRPAQPTAPVVRDPEPADTVATKAASLDVAIRITEEPLTARNLATITSAITDLHAKAFLIQRNRFSDLVNFAQTRNPRFTQEANLVITKITHNSPADLNLRVDLATVGDAVRTAIDAVAHTPLRLKEAQLNNQAKVLELKLKEQEAQSAEQARSIEAEKARIEMQRELLEVQRQQLALQAERLELEHKRLDMAVDTALKMVERLNPNVVDAEQKAALAQALVPQLLQLGNGVGLELSLPSPQDLAEK